MTTDTPVTAPRNAGTTGRISLVGIGPGHTDHMTARARAAIAEADVVVGYVTYIKLVADLLDGKEVVRKGMTEELDRAVHALAAARAGKKVALISSGDAGVYGMAGPTYEVLFQAGWTPEDHVAVEIVPGASAINACAALVGAPLTHDFCSISLSDLLTPWPVIARRLDAAAAADFVVAFYNPKSGRRTRQIVEAQRLFLRHRRADTPVAIVKSAYRRRQHIVHTTLDQMAEQEEADPDYGFFSPYSWWPLWLGLSAAICFLGLAVGWWVFAIGAFFAVPALIGWTFEYWKGAHHL